MYVVVKAKKSKDDGRILDRALEHPMPECTRHRTYIGKAQMKKKRSNTKKNIEAETALAFLVFF